MSRFNHLSIKSKLQIMLLVASLGSILVVGYLSWSKAREILTERIFSQLTSVRASKANQIESYFNTLRGQLETFCENRMVVTAMTEFDLAFDQLNQRSIPSAWDQTIETYYNREFLPRLAQNIEGTPIFETYRPTSPESRYLQYHYIAKNPNPVGKKDELAQANDRSNYSQIHARYHNLFRNLIKRFGYYDLFLIDAETGDVVYSVYKETDFSSNLYTGAYRNSNLAEVVKRVRDNPDLGAIQLVDFQFYRPSYNAPAAFLAGSIYDGPRRVGILAVQLPVDEINNVLTGNRNWKQDGLGNTGETYLVGDDSRLRSAARLLIENPSAYLNVLRENRVKSETVRLIERLKTSLLLHSIETDAASEAIRGKSGTQIIQGYGGSEVLSSYAALNIRGVNWGIISEMALSEAYAPINTLQHYLLLSTIVLILLVSLFATLAAHHFMRPIDLMIQRSRLAFQGESVNQSANQLANQPAKAEANRMNNGINNGTDQADTFNLADASPEKEFSANDELSELAGIFNGMMQQVRQKTAAIALQKQENEILLLNIFPRPVMERWKKGETRLVDQAQQVTVAVIRIVGLTKATAQQGSQTVASGFDEFIALLDDRAEKYDVERLNCFSDRYIAACGLTKPRLDHVKRMVDFAQEALGLIKNVNQKYGLGLSVRIGIHAGVVTTALIGRKKIRYDLWGEPLSVANQLGQQAEANTIRVTEAVCDRTQDLFPFEPDQPIMLEDKQTLPTWVLGKTGMRDLISELTLGLNLDDDDGSNTKRTQDGTL